MVNFKQLAHLTTFGTSKILAIAKMIRFLYLTPFQWHHLHLNWLIPYIIHLLI